MDNKINEYIEKNKEKYISELSKLISFKTVAMDKNSKNEFDNCTDYIKNLLSDYVDKITLITDFGNPIIIAEKHISDDLPTVLLYAHYDVQPETPLDLWNSDPFILTKKGDFLLGRGVADDKSHLLEIIKTLELIKKNDLNLKYNIKILFEPSEECGSKELNNFLDSNLKEVNLLKCDTLLACDSSLISNEKPSITVGLRGCVDFELTIIGPNKDIHSGMYGGVIGNPIHELCRLIDIIHDENNKITIENFYNGVENNYNLREMLNKLPNNEDELKHDLDVDDFIIEQGFTSIETSRIRPTFEVNGIFGGYEGEGGKTIIPNKCTAKISCRLVNNQKTDDIYNYFWDFIKKNIRKNFKFNIIRNSKGSSAVESNINCDEIKKFINIMKEEYYQNNTNINKEILFDRSGGSIPIMTKLNEKYGCNIIFVGFVNSNSNCHGPNENCEILSIEKGIKILTTYLIS